MECITFFKCKIDTFPDLTHRHTLSEHHCYSENYYYLCSVMIRMTLANEAGIYP